MPLLEVEIVGDIDPARREGLASRIADAAGQVLDSRPRGTWVRLRWLAPEHYAENAGGPEPGIAPVFVHVMKAQLPEGAEREAEVRALTQAVAAACGRPALHVHVLYDPPGAGRVAFGGELVGP
jgi:phenylpyruvate tautomerase PptA (4-oxalocrotonate tautomerase family)